MLPISGTKGKFYYIGDIDAWQLRTVKKLDAHRPPKLYASCCTSLSLPLAAPHLPKNPPASGMS